MPNTREKLIELLEKQRGYTLPVWIASQTVEIIADALITNGVTVQEWIPVTERLPDRKEYDWVLVLPELTPEGYYGVPAVAELRNGKWHISDCVEPFEEAFNVKVTHWMPVPEFPKGENE